MPQISPMNWLFIIFMLIFVIILFSMSLSPFLKPTVKKITFYSKSKFLSW